MHTQWDPYTDDGPYWNPHLMTQQQLMVHVGMPAAAPDEETHAACWDRAPPAPLNLDGTLGTPGISAADLLNNGIPTVGGDASHDVKEVGENVDGALQCNAYLIPMQHIPVPVTHDDADCNPYLIPMKHTPVPVVAQTEKPQTPDEEINAGDVNPREYNHDNWEHAVLDEDENWEHAVNDGVQNETDAVHEEVTPPDDLERVVPPNWRPDPNGLYIVSNARYVRVPIEKGMPRKFWPRIQHFLDEMQRTAEEPNQKRGKRVRGGRRLHEYSAMYGKPKQHSGGGHMQASSYR